MFAAYPMPFGELTDNPVHTVLVPQRRIEQVLAERAIELGVQLRRGVELAWKLAAEIHGWARIAELISGADIRYNGNTGWAPDLYINGTRLAELTRTARPLLLDLTGDTSLAEVAPPWRDRVDVLTGTSTDTSATGLLLRPDRYVAWQSHAARPDRAALRAASPGGSAPEPISRLTGSRPGDPASRAGRGPGHRSRRREPDQTVFLSCSSW